ncbi:MAG: arginine--tRNA ligase [Flavobacteriia bacterium]
MENAIKEFLLQQSSTLFGTDVSSGMVQVQRTKKDVSGDLTLLLFPFVKALKSSPLELGEKLSKALKAEFKGIQHIEVLGGFLNIHLSSEYWINALDVIQKDSNFGFQEADSKPLFMVEYASPNTNKPLHLGHLRNIFLGYSVAEILKANGHKVIKTQIINDRGIHICKSMLAWERFSPLNAKGERETPQNTGLKGDKLVGKYYVEFDRNFNAEAKLIIENWEQGMFDSCSEDVVAEFNRLTEAKEGKDEKALAGIEDKIKDLAKNQTTLLRDAKEMLVKWEARDPQVYLLWNTMNGWVYEGFDVTYKSIGVDFDKSYYESDTFLLGKDIVVDGLNKGVFYKKDDGSVWIDLTDCGLDEKLVLRSDGTAVYITQDIGTAVDRYKDYPGMNGIIYTVGNEQDYHFKVLFLILEKLGYSWAENCSHLSYGMVDLPSGKMKSREGTVVDADDLIAEVVQKATEMTRERGHLEGMTDANKSHLFNIIGLGGLKYYLLKVDPKKRMLFNPEESIELNGNTGPFIQYTHARICSLLAKANYSPQNLGDCQLLDEEKEVIKLLTEYPLVIDEAGIALSPAVLANYIYELVKSYNHFYQTIPILIETDEKLKNIRLAMSANVAKVIRSSMKLLGVEVPERM